MKITSLHCKYLVAGLIIAAGLSALAGFPVLSPDMLVGLSAIGMVGEISMVEVKTALDAQGKAWEDFKKTNDELMKAKADGKAVGDLETKLAKIGADLDKFTEAKANIEEQILTLGRDLASGGSGTGSKKEEAEIELKSFNDYRRARDASGRSVTDLDLKAYADYKSAFFKCIRGGPAMLSSDEVKAMSAGTDSDGGFLLPFSTVGRIVKKVFDLSPIRQVATVQPISGPALEGVADLDESSYGWVSETGARTDTPTPTVGKYRIEAAEMYAAPKATQTLLDDSSVDIESWLGMKVADKFARVEGAAYINGTGVGQPRGFATYATAATADATRAWGTIEHVVTGANGAFHTTQADPLFTLLGAFKSAYLQNAKWVTTREVIAAIRKFKTTTTLEYIWQPGLQAGTPDRLLGYPIVNAQDVPALATNSLSMWLGDWAEAYTVVDRIGIRTLRDPFTSKPYVIFYSTKRTGGAVVNFEAIKAIKFST